MPPLCRRPCPRELLSQSDLVGLIRVLSVTCTKVDKDERTGETLPSYEARAELHGFASDLPNAKNAA